MLVRLATVGTARMFVCDIGDEESIHGKYIGNQQCAECGGNGLTFHHTAQAQAGDGVVNIIVDRLICESYEFGGEEFDGCHREYRTYLGSDTDIFEP
jgi:hypothetical protein